MTVDRRDHARPLAVIAAAALVALVVMGVRVGSGAASDPVTLSAVNGTVNAGADRVEGGSDAFPNFRNGAFNSYSPLAHAHVDGSPSSEATASPADTGPFGQATAGGTFGSPPVTQPQYAEARYPPGTSKPVTFGSPGGPYALATAGRTSALARAEYASGGSGSSGAAARAASLGTLDSLLVAWRARWLTAADAARYPMVHPDASTPDGVTNGTADGAASIDSSTGLTVSGKAHVQSASFGGGAIHFGNVDVAVTIINAGNPAQDIVIDAGSATVGGVPVKINHDGLVINGAMVPGLGLALDQANSALNQVLTQAGYQVVTVAPTVTRSPNQETVDATGVQVTYTQPAVAPGVPRQQVVHQLGEVFVDSLAVPGTPPSNGGLTLGTPLTTPLSTGGSSQPSTVFVPGTPGTPAVPATPGSSESALAQSGSGGTLTRIVRRSKPLDLVLLYFLWQSLVIGTVASLWWRRLEHIEVP